jgi:hypothetical protein
MQSIINTIYSLINERTIPIQQNILSDITLDDLDLIILPNLCYIVDYYGLENDMCVN